jgi:hypothetical protein
MLRVTVCAGRIVYAGSDMRAGFAVRTACAANLRMQLRLKISKSINNLFF